MKKVTLVLLVLTLALGAVLFSSCDRDKDDKPIEPSMGLFFKPNGFADTVYCISESSMTGEEMTMAVSLQGILAQNRSAIYIYGSEGATLERIHALSEKNGFATETVGNVWQLVERFKDNLNGKYVLYADMADPNTLTNDQSINYATTVSGAEGFLMVSKGLENTAKMYGFTMGFDATATHVNTRYIFNTYKKQLNNSYLIHQSPSNRNLRDYAIAGKAMCYYADLYDGDNSVRLDILAWAKENAPILGWTENEVNFVSANSLQSVITVAADHAVNLTVYSADKTAKLTQSNHTLTTKTPQQGKHYVAIVMSDGDNVQWMTRGFAESAKYYGSPYRGDFPITWTTSPALYDLAPDVLSRLYQNATANDLFMAGPSGVGYVNASDYNSDSIESYAAKTVGYMQVTDLHYINFLDNAPDKAVLNNFSAYDQVKGGVWSVGNKYIEGEGAVYWSNDKPFLTARETLWRIPGDDNSNKYYGFVERVAQRINEYSTDCTKIEGYTVVLAHAWSIGSMDYINRFAEQLDDHVELVTVDQLLDMVSRNVPHKDAYPNDIAPSALDGKLYPISSEQYIWSEIAATKPTGVRNFVFDSPERASLWHSGDGGLQYDKVKWVDQDSEGKPAIMLDGSDLNDVVDPLPNSWIYNMFNISADENTDNFMYCYVSGSANADAHLRVRALYEENGKMQSVVLQSPDYLPNSTNDYGWYRHTTKTPHMLKYDLSQLKGKKVIISIEQDDTGDGSGEILYIQRVSITDKEMTATSSFPDWSKEDIREEWHLEGNVEMHGEGLCLEAEAGSSSISYMFSITEQTKMAKFYVRMFIRPIGQTPDIAPKLSLKVNGNIVKAVDSDGDYYRVSTDEYCCIIYDLSAYVGQQVTVEFISDEGNHAAIGRIVFAENCQAGEANRLYSAEQLNSI